MKHLISWTNSIGSPEDCSDGLLLKSSTMLWGQKPFDITATSYADFVYSDPEISESTRQLTIAVAAGDDKTVLARFVGCVIIGMIPERGLPEVLHSLGDMWEFYNEEPPKPQVSRLLPQKTEATVVGRKKRPDMVISR